MIGFINGSPKAGKSNSRIIINLLTDRIDSESITISTAKYDESVWAQLHSCDRIVLVFPLYVDSLPAHLLEFLMQWEQKRSGSECDSIRMYVVAQCGFCEGKQNVNALDIVRHFCRHSGIVFSGGIGLGGAGCLAGGAETFLKPLKSLLFQLSECIAASKTYEGNSFADIGMPRWMYQIGGNLNWVMEAKKNGLSKKDLWRKNLDIRS